MAPSVALANPTNHAVFASGTNIVVTASANDPNGSIAQIDFYAGKSWLGSAVSAPYSMIWSNVPGGTFAVNAVATDDRGATRDAGGKPTTIHCRDRLVAGRPCEGHPGNRIAARILRRG